MDMVTAAGAFDQKIYTYVPCAVLNSFQSIIDDYHLSSATTVVRCYGQTIERPSCVQAKPKIMIVNVVFSRSGQNLRVWWLQESEVRQIAH